MSQSSKDKFTVTKSMRDNTASKPFSESRRVIPSTEQSLQSITENLIRIYGKLEKLEKKEPSKSSLEERLKMLEDKIDGMIESKIDMMETSSQLYNIENKISEFDDQKIISKLSEIEGKLENIENNNDLVLKLSEVEERLNRVESEVIEGEVRDALVRLTASTNAINSYSVHTWEKVLLLSDEMKNMSITLQHNSNEVNDAFDEISSLYHNLGDISDRQTSLLSKEISSFSKNTEESFNLIHSRFTDEISETREELEKMISSVSGQIIRNSGTSYSDVLKLQNTLREQILCIESVKEEVKEGNGELALQALKIESIKDDLDDINQELSSENRRIKSMEENMKGMEKDITDKVLSALDSMGGELLERTISQLNSVEDNVLEVIQETSATVCENVDSQLNNLRDDLTKEVSSRLDFIGLRIGTISKESIEISGDIIHIREDLQEISENQDTLVNNFEETSKNTQNKLSSAIAELISIQHATKELSINMGSTPSHNRGNVLSHSGMDKISKDIKELGEEIVESNKIVKEIQEKENSYEYVDVDEDEVREEFNDNFRNILKGQKDIKTQQEKFEDKVNEKLDNISESQRIMQQEQKICKEKFLEEVEKMGDNTSSMAEDLDKKMNKTKIEYIDSMKYEMDLSKNSIIKGVTKAVFPAKSEDGNSVYVSSRKEGVRYLGREKQ